MKYLLIGLGTLAILLTVCVVCGAAADACLTRLEATLREAEAPMLREDYRAVREIAEDASAQWEAYSGFFGSILSHAELEEITTRLERVRAYAVTEDLPELYASYTELLEAITHLRELDSLRYENLL